MPAGVLENTERSWNDVFLCGFRCLISELFSRYFVVVELLNLLRIPAQDLAYYWRNEIDLACGGQPDAG
jgi:hypothetical protein